MSRLNIPCHLGRHAAWLLVGLMVTSHSVWAQEVATPPHQYLGINGCVLCHSQKDTQVAEFLQQDFVSLNEATVFRESGDRHRLAYEVLVKPGSPGRSIAERLELGDLSDPKNAKAQACLSCHAGWNAHQSRPPQVEFGVSCETCHGASQHWEAQHKTLPWRAMTPAEKSQTGMTNVRDPITRARLCLSCHLGNPAEGKVVTHAMYAAGHPPLPGIEIQTFIRQMPAHWLSLREKGPFDSREQYLAANQDSLGSKPLEDFPQAKAVLIGALETQRAALLLMGELAAQASTHPESWPELAAFDCGACHHELQSPSWRQARGYRGRIPGRPQPPHWPGTMIPSALKQLHPDTQSLDTAWKAYDQLHAEYLKAVNQKPFGETASVAETARKLAEHLDALSRQVARSPLTQADAERYATILLTLSNEEYPDFHAARQMIWSWETVRLELDSSFPDYSPINSEADKTTRFHEQRKLRELWKKDRLAPAAQSLTDLFQKTKLSEHLVLDLRTAPDSQTDLKRLLDGVMLFQPRAFREQLGNLSKP